MVVPDFPHHVVQRRGEKGVTHEKAAVKSLGALDKKIELFQAVFTKSEHI